jgi:hypothetical protein
VRSRLRNSGLSLLFGGKKGQERVGLMASVLVDVRTKFLFQMIQYLKSGFTCYDESLHNFTKSV